MATTTTQRSNHTKPQNDGLEAWVVVVIVISVIVLLCVLGAVAFFGVRKIKERRRNHGEYRPQLEENNARDLPVIQPPNIDGLI
ncbi:unnamed protein product [Bursaphelenchus okinawaensis]|uniref:Uncharacterized protein n=1 Tax=Bursaphelenchus okinawaensis TaxID=465554 RepID=A0A811LI69_9BILA|nr:unnamed protein product [Bursaphelenchus okinawaensis]CAG9126212.1 unnamed protein product [Bursaphelenchus okinawaensis]